MKDTVFINQAVDMAFKSYIDSKEKEGLVYNSFLVVVLRILVLIYEEDAILNPYYLQDSVAFINHLGEYGFSKMSITTFLEDMLNYLRFENQNEQLKVKAKNPYFTKVQKYLVDMFVAKKNKIGINYQEEEAFLDLLYTSHTSNYYRLSYNYLASEDPNYIEKYYYTKVNNLEMTRVDLNKTISGNINLEALKYMGIDLANMNNMSEKERAEVENQVYNYFEVDVESLNKETKLKDAMDYYQKYGRKVTTGNGYVDILLLLSVIITSLSVLVIIIIRII